MGGEPKKQNVSGTGNSRIWDVDMNSMNKTIAVACLLACLACLTAETGCRKDDSKRPAATNQDDLLRAQLAGKWRRDWELGPVVYARELNPDGSLVMEEFRVFDAAAQAAGKKPEPDKGVQHRGYPNSRLCKWQSLRGTWAVQDGNIAYRVALSNGDPLTLTYKLERVSATEVVESTIGLDGKVESKFLRDRT